MRKTESVSKVYLNNIPFSVIRSEYETVSEDNTTNIAVVLSSLPEAERNIIIMYAELGSLKKLSKVFNCSKATMWNRVQEIRNKLYGRVKYE